MSETEEFWRDRRVLVTGCTGLVGAWTTRALLERGRTSSASCAIRSTARSWCAGGWTAASTSSAAASRTNG